MSVVNVKAKYTKDSLQAHQKKLAKKKAKSALAEVRDELKKVTWPIKAELKFCTQVVIGATFIFGIGIYVVDLMVKGLLDGIQMLSKMIFG